MIATLSAIVYVVSERQELISSSTKMIQRGQAISKLNDKDFQIYHYTLFRPVDDQSENEESDDEAVQLFEKDCVYLIHAKFSATNDGNLHVSITNNLLLDIYHENIPISKPLVHLLGRTDNHAGKSEFGYQVSLQVKPYLSSEQCGPFSVTLLHGLDGRLKKAFENTRKYSLVHATGILVVHESKLYCEILEYQFISSKSDSNIITVPWKQTNSNVSEGASKVEKQIAAAHKLSSTAPPSATTSKRGRPSKGKGKATKIGDMALSLLDKQAPNDKNNDGDQENQPTQDTLPDEQVTNDNEYLDISDDSEEGDEPQGSQKRSRVKTNSKNRTTRNSNK